MSLGILRCAQSSMLLKMNMIGIWRKEKKEAELDKQRKAEELEAAKGGKKERKPAKKEDEEEEEAEEQMPVFDKS